MNDTFSSLLESREMTLRLRWIGLAVVTIAILILREFLYFDLLPILAVAALALVELLIVTFLLRRLKAHPTWKHAYRLLWFVIHAQVLIELALVIWAVHFTGGIASPLLAALLIYLFVNGLQVEDPVRAVPLSLLFHSAWALALVVGLAVGEFYGYIPHVSVGIVPDVDLYSNAHFVDAVLIVFTALLIITVAVAVQISRHTRKREEALAASAQALARHIDQVNTLRDIGQRLVSSLELNAVLDAIGENALRLSSATDAHIFLYEGSTGQFTAGMGVWADGHRGLAVALPRADGLCATVVRAKQAVIIGDAQTHPLYASLQARAWGIKAIAGFPLKKAEAVLGVMTVAFLEPPLQDVPHAFSAEEVAALGAVADQAAIAIDNARLYSQVQRKIDDLSALYAVASAASQLRERQALLNDALGVVAAAAKADAALIAELDEGRDQLRLAAQRGLAPLAVNEIKARALKPREGWVGAALQVQDLARASQPVAVADVANDPRNVGGAWTLDPFQSLYVLPLRAQDQTLGVLQLLWKEKHEVAPAEMNLLGAFGQQLAVAMHNANLYDETQRRADELASLRAIGLATTCTLNLREQLRLLYEKVSQLLQPDTFVVALYDETRNELTIEYLVEEGWFMRRAPIALEAAGLAAWVIRNQKSLNLPDLAVEEGLPAKPHHYTRPARAWLGVPLVLKDSTVGLISVQSFRPDAFSAEDERFLVAAAQQVALGVDNARLFAESERRARELMLINEIGRAISASLDLKVILDRAAHALCDLLGYRYVSIYLLQGEVLQLEVEHPVRASGINESPTAERIASGSKGVLSNAHTGLAGRVARSGRAVFVTNVAGDPDYVATIPGGVAEVAVPIQREGRVLGVVDVQESRVGALKEDDLSLLIALADQLGIAVMNAEAYQEALARERFANSLGRLGMTLAATLDAAQLVQVLCREALGILSVDGAVLFLREAANWVCVARAGSVGARAEGLSISANDATNLVARTARLGRGLVLHAALAVEEPVRVDQVEDLAHPALHRGAVRISSELYAALGGQALLSTPLIKEREVMGVLVLVDERNPARFGEADSARAAIVAGQGALALANARLYEETQRRAAEVTSLYEIGLAVSSTLDLGEQFHIIYDQVTRHFHPEVFYIAFQDETGGALNFPFYVERGRVLEPFTQSLQVAGLPGWIIQTRRPLVIDDLYRELSKGVLSDVSKGISSNAPSLTGSSTLQPRGEARDVPDLGPLQDVPPPENAAFLGVPLLSKGHAVGCLGLRRAVSEPFTVDEQRFILSLAQHVAVAVESARLHEQQRRLAAQQGLLYQAGRKIAGAPNLNLLLQTIVDSMQRDFGYQAVLVMLLDQEKGELYQAALSEDIAARVPSDYRQKIGVGLMGQAALTGTTQLANDVSQNPYFYALETWHPPLQDVPPLAGSSTLQPRGEARDVPDVPRAELAVPIKVGRSVVGVINVESERVNAFAPQDVQMVESLADQLAVAMENARLYEQTRGQLEELKQTQERLVESERRAAVGELAAGLAHEINNPLTAIIGHTQLLLQSSKGVLSNAPPHEVEDPVRVQDPVRTGVTESPVGMEELATISTAAQRIARIVQEFMRFANLDSMRGQVLDLRMLVREAAEAFENRSDAQDIALSLQLPAEPQWVNANANLLNQVVMNILLNALEAMPHGGTIDLAVSEEPGVEDLAHPALHRGAVRVKDPVRTEIVCRVKDSGTGIAETDLKRVFEPGYTTKVEAGVVRGIGLGLYAAERIIKNYRGRIWLESKPGQGTVVGFALPRAKGPSADGE